MKNTYKLGVAGTHSTGKTTFLNELEAGLKSRGLLVGRVADLATEAREKGFPILREHTFESTAWIVCRGMTLELEAARLNQVVLVDRPVLDAYGYLEAALAHRKTVLEGNQRAYLDTIVRLHAPTYDRLLMTRIDPSVAIDGTKERDLDPVFRRMAETGIDRVIERLSIEAADLASAPDERCAERDRMLDDIATTIAERAASAG